MDSSSPSGALPLSQLWRPTAIKRCGVAGCAGTLSWSGEFCAPHQWQATKHGDPLHGDQVVPVVVVPTKAEKVCKVDGCHGRHSAAGYCSSHRRRFKEHGKPDFAPRRTVRDPVCTVEGCDAPHLALGFCKSHCRRFKLYGDPLGVPTPREVRVCVVESCELPHFANGYCAPHKARLVRVGDVQAHIPIATRRPRVTVSETGAP